MLWLSTDPVCVCVCVCVSVWSCVRSYYSLDDVSHETINKYLSNLVEGGLRDLECSYCLEIQEVCWTRTAAHSMQCLRAHSQAIILEYGTGQLCLV